MMDIERQFDMGIQNANSIIYNNQLNSLVAYCMKLVNEILPKQREYKNQTGNTVTSYSFGIYYGGHIVYIGSNELKDPVRAKLQKGEKWSGVNYDGLETDLYGTIDTDGGYGESTAKSFLNSYKPTTKSFAVVITTGTEYSSYLENKHHLNVLSDSFETVSSDLLNSFIPIK